MNGVGAVASLPYRLSKRDYITFVIRFLASRLEGYETLKESNVTACSSLGKIAQKIRSCEKDRGAQAYIPISCFRSLAFDGSAGGITFGCEGYRQRRFDKEIKRFIRVTNYF